MPIFDHSASRPGCAEAGLLRSVLGPARPRSPSVQPLPREDRGRQRRASVMRASVVLALLGLFCGSAVVMSEKPQPPPGAAPVSASCRGPSARSSTRQGQAGSAGLRSLTEMTYCLWSEDPGEAPAASRLVAEADTDSGALHARSC